MIIKNCDDRTGDVETLERLAVGADGPTRKNIEAELRNLRSGVKGEKDAAYFIDFDLSSSKNWVIIHDLRVEVGSRVAQIDHLLINRVLEVFVLETKSLHASLKITEDGEFLRFNEWKKTYEGMPSPLAQNERHVAVLKEAIKQVALPSRLGVRLEPTFEPYVLISPKTRIDRPKAFDTSRVVKADVFVKTIQKQVDDENAARMLLAMAKVVGQDTLEDVGRKIASLHRPLSIDYASKFGLAAGSAKPSKSEQARATDEPQATSTCRHCSSKRLSIVYGKYGYYFKCADCEGNTAIRLGCGQEGHKERIRKEGLRFFRECSQCGTSRLFYTNARESLGKV